MRFLDTSNNKLLSRLQETRAQRERSIKAIYSGRPLDAESDVTRKINRIEAVAHVDNDCAKKIAEYDETTLCYLTSSSIAGAESIQGKSVDFISISFLELARAAASAVGRVVFRNLSPQGTGFMISDKLFLTNNHVIKTVEEANNFLIEFNYELDYNNKPKEVTRFELDPSTFFVSSPIDDLDYTIIAVGNRIDGKLSIAEFGYCPITNADDKHALGEFANIIQHPQGGFKQVVLRENQLVARNQDVVHYLSDTQNGSSGSPVFNDQWEAIALHHWGGPTEYANPINGQAERKDVNEGIRISAVVNDLKSKLDQLSAEKKILLNEALKCNFSQPSMIANIKEKNELPENKTVIKKYDEKSSISEEQTAKWIVPLEISIRLKNNISTIPVHEDLIDLSEAVRIDPEYENRNGYNPNFLPDQPVPLPNLNEAQKKQAALIDNESVNPFELKYQHFSITMNAERRIAFFTAVNIDGSTWININRATGESNEPEATERWFKDPRIPAEAQCNQDLYERQLPNRVFDRGHLVRRQDPSWGTRTRARRANADTFHFTNCAPQQMNFNESSKYWQGIENYVLDKAKADRERITVFTGPIFTEQDPKYRFVNVPMRFWKIVIRVDNGKLMATALLADQRPLINELPERAGDVIVHQYQVSIKEVEDLTGLDFGKLHDYDTFIQGPEAVSQMKEINSYSDISLGL